MCGTCGCGSGENGVRIQNPKDIKAHEHTHSHVDAKGHVFEHSHDGHFQEHAHTHEHEHVQEHQHQRKIIDVEKDILHHNDLMAARNRGFFEAKNIFALNLVSSPGSGKTSILERTLKDLKDTIPFFVIEGDQQTLNDANRIAAIDIPVIQINTGKGCHLESDTIYEAIKKLDIADQAVLMIENVGNLVCPSMFDLGESKRVVIISTTEGEDKPIKYPDMFHTSDLCIINKIDLLPYINVNLDILKQYALKVNPKLEFIEISASTGEGMEVWYTWLKKNRNQPKN